MSIFFYLSHKQSHRKDKPNDGIELSPVQSLSSPTIVRGKKVDHHTHCGFSSPLLVHLSSTYTCSITLHSFSDTFLSVHEEKFSEVFYCQNNIIFSSSTTTIHRLSAYNMSTLISVDGQTANAEIKYPQKIKQTNKQKLELYFLTRSIHALLVDGKTDNSTRTLLFQKSELSLLTISDFVFMVYIHLFLDY